ncbi:penicillin-binding protein activator [Marinimicrobium sp. ABcell2]|uniref:penicillin-binding protein activator n=1 Tax=Marinimicrobium sp. ABcell2 TaxID=3069751 RepID=UPI0027AE5762|nr:penicillin-binding protein activator [Marinimicrobium sp. ABcell2]MDQ2075075.1 penicillin-binding protein activator [Marinimicrobium sp. ABcell2]
MLNRGIYCALAALMALALASCGSTPTQSTFTDDPVTLSAEQIEARVRELVDSARASSGPERDDYLLRAAELLVQQQENDWARNLLTSIDARQLEDAAFIKHSQLLAQVALQDSSYLLAESILTNPRLEQQWYDLSPEQEVALRGMRAVLFERRGEIPSAINERIQLGSLLTTEEDELHNREAIWHSLMTLPRNELEGLARQESNYTLRGWYSLAALSKNNQTNLERQQQRVEEWQSDWPQHPANRNLPQDLQLLRQLVEQAPSQIALLLPQQGNLAQAGDAVRDGFMAAYYHALSEQSRVPQIRQYDSAGDIDILTLYEQAVAEGAEFIIGPLDRDKVQTLSEQEELPVPILTLNYTESSNPYLAGLESPAGFYQFGLAAEDEARQVARRAYLDGHRYALVITPDRNWSERSALAFTDEWLALGGHVVNISQFINSGYSRIIQEALLIDQSQARRQELVRLFGAQVEFEPRRRQDLDMIFLIANPEQGRQIKPTLAFHYAGQVPVYSTSHIYSGEEDRASDGDLNGVRFNTMPWLFDQDSPEKQAIVEHVRAPAIYSRMHALGVDAYHLHPRLPQLAQVTQARLYGATGALQMLPGGRIEREQVWVEFSRGTVQPLAPTLADIEVE